MSKPGRVLRDQSFQRQQHVMDDIGIGVLVDCDSARRVRRVDRYRSVLNSRLLDILANSVGDFDKLVTLHRGNGKSIHGKSARWWGGFGLEEIRFQPVR